MTFSDPADVYVTFNILMSSFICVATFGIRYFLNAVVSAAYAIATRLKYPVLHIRIVCHHKINFILCVFPSGPVGVVFVSAFCLK